MVLLVLSLQTLAGCQTMSHHIPGGWPLVSCQTPGSRPLALSHQNCGRLPTMTHHFWRLVIGNMPDTPNSHYICNWQPTRCYNLFGKMSGLLKARCQLLVLWFEVLQLNKLNVTNQWLILKQFCTYISNILQYIICPKSSCKEFCIWINSILSK